MQNMILISIPWYDGLQIKLAYYKIFNIKCWIHLDMFPLMDSATTVKYHSIMAYISYKKPKKQNFPLYIW